MCIRIDLTPEPIRRPDPATSGGTVGAWVEFSGVVRGEEAGADIAALEYEAYDTMAQQVMHELLSELTARHGCESAHVIHRIGIIPVGETALWIRAGSAHRQNAIALVSEFLDRLKQEVPIWKRRALTAGQLASATK